ncbi:Hypothetical predicted protein [Pelobates cultripes]|uniref:Uncharacterized protein n=1 Tax=Pelobates cultripes TaxID=61616 RepID=A0AAD1SII9_PELCU|nr:Hypothetical predicted protein [Pelobates cultripes]
MVDTQKLHVSISTLPMTTIQDAFKRLLTNVDKLFESFLAKLSSSTKVLPAQNRKRKEGRDREEVSGPSPGITLPQATNPSVVAPPGLKAPGDTIHLHLPHRLGTHCRWRRSIPGISCRTPPGKD